jgi:hypothetical protein
MTEDGQTDISPVEDSTDVSPLRQRTLWKGFSNSVAKATVARIPDCGVVATPGLDTFTLPGQPSTDTASGFRFGMLAGVMAISKL